MSFTFDLNIAESYLSGRYVLNTPDGLFFDLTREVGVAGYYGAFYDTTAQAPTFINTPQTITIGSVYSQNGVAIVDGNRVSYTNSGIYHLTCNLQFANDDLDTHQVRVWLHKNGVIEANTARTFTIMARRGLQRGYTHVAIDVVVVANAGNYHQIMWSVDDIDTAIETVAGAGSIPTAPGVLVNVVQIKNLP